jgi:hypothetical protein
MSVQLTWVENVTADIEGDALVALFQEHHAGKAEALLAEYLADNPDEDECKLILAAIRAQDSTVEVEYSDVTHDA